MGRPIARPVPGLRIVRNPRITPKQLHAFYTRTGVCEAGFPPAEVGKVLGHSDVVLAAYQGNTLVGFARGLCDGLAGYVAELCVDPALQGRSTRHSNASLIEGDTAGLGRWLGASLLVELRKLGASFFSVYAVDGVEDTFYKSLGFEENTGHTMYYIDTRAYVPRRKRGGSFPSVGEATRLPGSQRER